MVLLFFIRILQYGQNSSTHNSYAACSYCGNSTDPNGTRAGSINSGSNNRTATSGRDAVVGILAGIASAAQDGLVARSLHAHQIALAVVVWWYLYEDGKLEMQLFCEIHGDKIIITNKQPFGWKFAHQHSICDNRFTPTKATTCKNLNQHAFI